MPIPASSTLAPRAHPVTLRHTLLSVAATLCATPCVHGQTPPPDDGAMIVVVGKRASLATALGIKRDAPEIVDAVVADDIQKLPDHNVTDALSRVPGVQILRDRGEGAGIAIRGLTQMETTLNGREIFTAGSGRNLDFADIPSELIAGIDVYKTASAGQIEGGIGGLIDLRTRRPFDFKGREIAASARYLHGDLIGGGKNQYALLASDRWKLPGGGEFGALLNVAAQERAWREDQKSAGIPLARTDILPGQTVVAPNGTSETVSLGERKRDAANLVLQWRPSAALDFYAEAHHAEFRTRQDSHQINIGAAPGFVAGSATLFPGTHDLQGITWTNAPVSILSFARDTVDRDTQVAVGGTWFGDTLTLKADLSRTRSYNNLYFAGPVLGGTAASFSQNLSGAIPATSIAGTNLLDPASLQVKTLAYRTRPFDGDLTAFRFDGEQQVFGDWIDSISAGIRLARRRADNAPGLIVADASVPGAPTAAAMPGYFLPSPYDFFPGSSSIGTYLIGDLSGARDPAALRAVYGIVAPVPAGNPLGIWHIEEDTQAAYIAAGIRSLDHPFDGKLGLRAVRTREAVSGSQSLPASGTVAPIRVDADYTDLLPSINLRYRVDAGLYLRAAAAKTVTRPDFNQLSPSLTLVRNPVNPLQNQGSAGNPELRPVRADNFDFSIERYFGKTAALHFAGFLKKVDGFVATASNPETWQGETYQVSRPQNGAGADLRGFELGYQQFYDFLPGWLGGLGMQANYTYVDSKTPSSVLGQNVPLQNLSRHSLNLVGIYERGPVAARVAWNWRDKFLSRVDNFVGVGAVPVYTKAYGWLDASLSYRIDDNLSLAIEGLNLLRTQRYAYNGVETRPQSVWLNDRQIGLILNLRLR